METNTQQNNEIEPRHHTSFEVKLAPLRQEENSPPIIYEGPLDLMLDAISRKKLNIFDIDISIILDAFLEYIGTLRDNKIDVASDFIETAARLVYIKTSLLLPKHDDGAENAKKELEGRLIDRVLLIELSRQLAAVYKGDVVFTRQPMKIDGKITYPYERKHAPRELISAYRAILNSSGESKKKSGSYEPPQIIVPKHFVSIFTKVIYVLRRLVKTGLYPLAEIYDGQTREEQVVVFLAVLNMLVEGRIAITSFPDSRGDYLELIKRSKG